MGGEFNPFPNSWLFDVVTLLFPLVGLAVIGGFGYLLYRLVRALERIADRQDRQ